MWPIAVILILIIQFSEIDLFVGISDLTNTLQNSCLSFTPESFYSDIYGALVCGNKLPSTSFSQNLKNLGIYHVIIVSGSHLVFLSLILEKLFSQTRSLKILVLPLLMIYALATGAQPPVMRALFTIGIGSFQEKKKLFWSHNEVVFISGLLCIALFDPWINSYSLLLSYVASVSLSLTRSVSWISKNIWIYLLILPFLLPLSAPGPLSVLSNLILTPIIGVVLFPLSFFSFLVPYFYFVVDPLWKVFFAVCSLVGPELQSLDKIPIPVSYLWPFALFLNFYGIYRDKRGSK